MTSNGRAWSGRSWKQLVACAAILLSAPAGAATLCVNVGGTSGCFADIQTAIDAAGDDDVIAIAAGTYAGSLDIAGPVNLTLQGTGSAATIIDGTGSSDHALIIRAGARVTLEDLAIENAQQGAPILGNAGLAIGSGKVTVRRCRFAFNSVHGISTGGAKVEVVDSTFEGNGFAGLTTGKSQVLVRNGAFHGNENGIVVREGLAKVESSTFSGNSGAGVLVEELDRGARVALRNSTVTDNATGLLLVEGRASINATILAGNTADCARVVAEPSDLVRTKGYNLIGDPGNCLIYGLTSKDQVGADPLLGPLADNGGFTLTHALLPGSPALGAVTRPQLCRDPDQRGIARSAPCDVGAFEAP
jgi:hypothetical protein